VRGISPEAMQAMQEYGWPGNVREVINVVERAVLLCEGDKILLEDLPEEISATRSPAHLADPQQNETETLVELRPEWLELPIREAKRSWLAAFEKEYLRGQLQQSRGVISTTAARAGIDPRSLYDKMRRFGLRKEDFKGGEEG
jgi:DNA-binding NtrC family response regulator